METYLSYYLFTPTRSGHKIALKKDFHRVVTPSLAKYSENPPLCTRSLQGLLEQLKKVLRPKKWSKTHVMILGTGGFRLIGPEISAKLLRASKDFFKRNKFKIADSDVMELSDNDEALLDWFSIQVLLGRLFKNTTTVPVLNLGPAAASVGFEPKDRRQVMGSELKTLKLYDCQHKIYTKSYLGLGLEEARYLILRKTDQLRSTLLLTRCIAPGYQFRWTYNGQEYTVKGMSSTSPTNFAGCQQEVRDLVKRYPPSASLTGTQPVAFSHYYYTAYSSGLLNSTTGGRVTVSRLRFAAEFRCQNFEGHLPFLCLDSVYIHTLFVLLFGLKEYDVVEFMGSYRGFKADRTLGAAFLGAMKWSK
ncbi:hypothetical protein RUM43_005954 [Polyplax serrata]|uniref:Uncharacterized protein n=1 Tax=Polyplax serrata TaxID=468196 RepID=A0AAN8PBX8_POLSC